MKKQLLLFLTAILSLNCYSQISYENGYYINNSDQKIDCYIKNIDWKNNPTDFEYKQSESGDTKDANIKSIKEFGIYNISKYIRNNVLIDRSSDNINHMSKDENPIFNEELLFLKVLVEGQANLYSYEDGSLKRYFYSNENSNIEQLVYKRYLTIDTKLLTSATKIMKNNQFKHQLRYDLNCHTFKMNKIENLEYKKNSLINLFTEYNKCNNSDFINFAEKKKRDLFNLNIRPRLNNTTLSINNDISNYLDTDFGSKLLFGFGVEAEFILPFNKNKWAITIEPTYHNFKSEKTTDVYNVSGGKLITIVDYNSIEIPIGLRHYFFLNQNSNIFTNIAYVFDLNLNSSIDFKRADDSNLRSLEIETQNNLAFGIGYKFNHKYSMEMRYQTSRKVLINYASWNSDYKTLSIIFGYSIF